MCIGLPMRVLSLTPGHALCAGRGETRQVRTALVEPLAVGDWLLVFLDNAQERLTPERAREVDATLDLLAAPLGDAAFALPSAMGHAQLLALTGGNP